MSQSLCCLAIIDQIENLSELWRQGLIVESLVLISNLISPHTDVLWSFCAFDLAVIELLATVNQQQS